MVVVLTLQGDVVVIGGGRLVEDREGVSWGERGGGRWEGTEEMMSGEL